MVAKLLSLYCGAHLVECYDKNHIFPLEVILKQRRSLHEKKNALYHLQISLFVPEIFKFLKYANYSKDGIIHSTTF